jgi:biopolymer transport protein ExbB
MSQSEQVTTNAPNTLTPGENSSVNPAANDTENSDAADALEPVDDAAQRTTTPTESNTFEEANPTTSSETQSVAPQEDVSGDANGPQEGVPSDAGDAISAGGPGDELPELLESTGVDSTAYAQVTELLDAGGPVLMVLLALSVVGLTIILLKWWQFTVLRLESRNEPSKALELWRNNQPDAAIELASEQRQPVMQLLKVIMTGLRRPDVDVAAVREEAVRVASVQLENLRSHLRALELIGTISPLLGLLGTVLGMIQAFQRLEMAGNQVDPSILSGGIWQALLTTAAGLIVAIPVVLAHAWLERKVERCGHGMEDAVTQLFTRNLQAIPLRPQATAEPNVNYAA